MNYQAYNLTDESRNLLLSKFTPLFENVILHHITYKFGVKNDAALPPEVKTVRVVGYTCNDNIECFVCWVDGSVNRPGGGTFHITFSHSDNASPKDSNDLLENGYQMIDSILINVVPAVN